MVDDRVGDKDERRRLYKMKTGSYKKKKDKPGEVDNKD